MTILKKLAEFSYHWAPHLCAESCKEYHRNWSMIRLLSLDSRPPAQSDYFKTQLDNYASSRKIKILISGAADTGLLSMVLDSTKHFKFQPEITIVDNCPTVILQHHLFSAAESLKVKLVNDNILKHKNCKYDVIVAHSFLNFFSEKDQKKLIAHWSSLLKTKGMVLIHNRTIKDLTETKDMIDESFIKKELLKIKGQLKQRELPLDILKSIDDFWTRPATRAKVFENTLIKSINEAGLSIKNHTYVQSNKTTNGPTALRFKRPKSIVSLITALKL